MATRMSDDFENEWTFVDKEGKVDIIEPRKNSVSYSKSPSYAEGSVSSFDSPSANDDSEVEAEFEVLSGFQCHPPPMEEKNLEPDPATKTQFDLPLSKESETRDELLAVQQSSCQCAADDGIMIISNHFCVDQDASSVEVIDDQLPSEVIDDDAGSMHSLTKSTDSNSNGWQELPLLSESGSFSFGNDANSSDEDNAIEPIPEQDENEDYEDLSPENEPLNEMVVSTSSVFSFDSDLFNPSDLDEDRVVEVNSSNITEVSKVIDEDRGIDEDDAQMVDHIAREGSNDISTFHVDLPTLFVVLGVTTALGFSIGYGLSVFISNQALGMSRSIKRPGPKTASLPLNSDSMEPLDEVSVDFLDQLEMWKLEERLETHEDLEHETEIDDLFDTKALHEKLQLKHFKLMGVHESVKQRLRMSKVMSWYWRLKYEEEKSSKGSSEWSKALQEQLEKTEKLYEQEKQIADLWRRMNENSKLRKAVAGGIKIDTYWKDYFHRWKRNGDRSVNVNASHKVSVETETPENKDSVGVIGSRELDVKSQGRSREHVWDNIWMDVRDRWTIDSHLKGDTGITGSCQTKHGKYSYLSERKDLSVFAEDRSVTSYSASVIERFLDRTVEKSVRDPTTPAKKSEHEKTEKSQPLDGERKGREGDSPSEEIWKDFRKRGAPFVNPLFPNGIFSVSHGIPEYFLNIDLKRNANSVSPSVTSQQKDLQVISYVDGTSDGNCLIDNDSFVKEALSMPNREDTKTPGKSIVTVGFQVVNSHKGLDMEKSGESSAVKRKVHRRSRYFKKKENGKRTSTQSDEHFVSKERQKLKNLTHFRGQEIRKQRILRRELKKKEREAKLRAAEADRMVSEMRRERRRFEKEKKSLQRSWKALKREKKRISSEKELHQKNRTEMNNFLVTLKKEKQKLKRKKVELKEKVKGLLAKERTKLKLKEKTLSAEKRKEVERFRKKISKEKNKLRQQKEELKSLKKASKEEYKKWLKELRIIKRQETERREAEQKKRNEKAEKKRGKAEMQYKREYESVIEEQARFDEEKRRKKKEKTHHTVASKKLDDVEPRKESVDDKAKRQDLRKISENDRSAQEEVGIQAKKEEDKESGELPHERIGQIFDYRETKNVESKEKIRKVKHKDIKRPGKWTNGKQRSKSKKDEKRGRRQREFAPVIAEQAEYDKEKRKRKGENGKSKFSKSEWKVRAKNVKKEASRPKDTKKDRKRIDSERSFKKQLEGIQKWLSHAHSSAFEQQQQGQAHWPWSDGKVSFRKKLEDVHRWLSDVPKRALERQGKMINWPWSLIKPYFDADGFEEKTSGSHHDTEEIKDKELKLRNLNSAKEKKAKRTKGREKSTERCDWKNGRIQAKEILSNTEKKGNKKKLTVSEEGRKSEIALLSDKRALADLTNFSFDMDLTGMLPQGDDKLKRAEKTLDELDKSTGTAFVIISEESTHNPGKNRFRKSPKSSVKKPKRPDGKPKRPRENQWWKVKNEYTVTRRVKSPRGPIAAENGRLTSDLSYKEANHRKVFPDTSSSEGPIPPKDIGLSVEEWLEKRFNLPKNSQKSSPQGPMFSDEVYRSRSFKGKKRRKRRNTDMRDKVCNSIDPETVETIPPPTWLFERAKGRTHQRSEPWYVLRAEDRDFKRGNDKYESWFPCDTKRKPYKGPLDPSWFFDRAHDRAVQRVNNVPWYTRRAEGRETERQKGEDSWFIERGYYRNDLRDLSSWYGDQHWMPQGPSMEEHR